jgi:hypothetical protein
MTIFQKLDQWMQANISKSWKTTAIGVAAGAYQIIQPLIAVGTLTWKDVTGAIFAVIVGMLVKDFNATGKTPPATQQPQPPEVKP